MHSGQYYWKRNTESKRCKSTETAKKRLGNDNAESTISRLDRNLEKLEQKRQLILKELG